MKIPKYCVFIGKVLHYQRRFPTRLAKHPNIAGKTHYKKRLKATLSEPVLLAKELDELNNSFERYISTLINANSHILDKIELQKSAEAFLEHNKLKPGMLAELQNYEFEIHKHWILETGIFESLDHYKFKQKHQRTPITVEPDISVQVQEYAWRMLNMPATHHPKHYLLSDCLRLYCKEKGIEERNRKNNRSRKHLEDFILHGGGDALVEQETIDNYLDAYVANRKHEVTSASINRGLNTIIAALRLANDTFRLNLNIKKPRFTNDHIAKPKPALTQEQQKQLLSLLKIENSALITPWKELFILLSLQSGAHTSELLVLKPSHVHLEDEIPYISLNQGDGMGKTEYRARHIPIVLELERIKYLINSGALNELQNKNSDNISHQINKLISKVEPKASAYSLRHTLKYNCDVAGIDSGVAATLGGWSGKELKLSKHMMEYGRTSKEITDRLRTLQAHQSRILAHLLPESDNNVLKLVRGANR